MLGRDTALTPLTKPRFYLLAQEAQRVQQDTDRQEDHRHGQQADQDFPPDRAIADPQPQRAFAMRPHEEATDIVAIRELIVEPCRLGSIVIAVVMVIEGVAAAAVAEATIFDAPCGVTVSGQAGADAACADGMGLPNQAPSWSAGTGSERDQVISCAPVGSR